MLALVLLYYFLLPRYGAIIASTALEVESDNAEVIATVSQDVGIVGDYYQTCPQVYPFLLLSCLLFLSVLLECKSSEANCLCRYSISVVVWRRL